MSRSIRFDWVAPTQRQDNTSLPAAAIQKIKLLKETTTPGQFSVVVDNISASATSYTLADVPPGTHKFGLIYVDTNNQDGQLAQVDNVVVPETGGGPPPAPPKFATSFVATVLPA